MVDDERSLAARLDFLHERVRDDMAVFRHGVGGHDDRLVALHTTRAEGPPSGWRQRHPPLTSVDGMVAEALTHHADPHSVYDFWCLYRRVLSLDSNIFLAQGVISFELSNTGDANGSREPDREPMTAGSTPCPAPRPQSSQLDGMPGDVQRSMATTPQDRLVSGRFVGSNPITGSSPAQTRDRGR